jgi:hypothetical protein
VQAIDHLERYLVEADVTQAFTHSMGGGGHPNSFVAILEGGVSVLVKTEEPTEDQKRMARREVAAWRLARMLEWPDLVSATVLRRITSLTTGADVEASVQVIWANKEMGTALSEFDEDNVWRAATFDALVRQTDRSASNWLGVPGDPSHGQREPKLIDHGYAFDMTRQGPAEFYQHFKGHDMPGSCIEALETAQSQIYALNRLLDGPELDGLISRAELLVETGVLDIKDL